MIDMFEREKDKSQPKHSALKDASTEKPIDNSQAKNSAPNPIQIQINIIPVQILILTNKFTYHNFITIYRTRTVNNKNQNIHKIR